MGCREVLEVRNGSEAFTALQEVGFVDVVQCDLQMEDRDGLEFILLDDYFSRRPAPLVRSIAVEQFNEEQVRHAFVEQQLEPYYQPNFDLLTGEVLGVKFLARWCHPSKELISPAASLPMVECSGLMDDLLFSMMNQALKLQA